MTAKSGSGGGGRKGRARRQAGGETQAPPEPPSTREKIARPLREAAARARRMFERLAGLRGAAARTLRGLRRHEDRMGDLEALQGIVEALDAHAATFDMPVDFTPLRQRLEALLSVLLEIGDDRLAAAAARPLAEDVAGILHRAEALFLVPEALYDALDPDAEDLAAVREAAAAESYDLARAALLNELRAKAPPEALVSWLLECPERCLGEAELASRGFCREGPGQSGRAAGTAWRFTGSPFRWEAVRFAAPHGHGETAVLARAYVATGNEALATEAVGRILGWAATVAASPASARQERSAEEGAACHPAWTPDLAAERLISWGACVLALRNSRAFSPEVARVLLLLAHESAEYLSRSAEAADAGAGSALSVAGALFAELAAARRWREEGQRILSDAAARHVLSDGGDTSRSLEVHERSLESFVTGALANGESSRAREAAKRMLAFERAVLMPGGGLPGEHDETAAAERERLLDLAGSLLGAPADGAAAAEFHAFEPSGVYVMRTGKGTDADGLLLRPGRVRGICVVCSGQEVLGGPATPLARAGDGPPRRVRPEADGPRSVVSRAGPPCDYVRVVSGLEGADGAPAATHGREVLFFERRWWALADRVREAQREDAWVLEFLLGGAPEFSSADGRRFVFGGLLVALAGPTDTGFRFEQDEHCRTVARAESAGPDVSFVTLLYPLRGEEPDSISLEPVASGTGRTAGLLLRREGEEDLVAFPHGEGTEFDAVPESVEAVALSRSGARWRKVFAVE